MFTTGDLTNQQTMEMGTLVDQQEETINIVETTAQGVEADTEKA